MKKYDFDEVIDRHGSGCTKIDDLRALFGKDDLTPLWIADMDFRVCPEITKALHDRISHPIYGYSRPGDTYWSSITGWLRNAVIPTNVGIVCISITVIRDAFFPLNLYLE